MGAAVARDRQICTCWTRSILIDDIYPDIPDLRLISSWQMVRTNE
jgi:hypothetical protein